VNAVRELDGFLERVQLFAGYADYEHTELEGTEIGTVFANEGWEARLEAIQAERDGWRAAYGVQVRNRDFSAIGEEACVPPSDTQQIGVYTFQQKSFGKFHLEGAARYENTEQTNTTADFSRDFNLFSVSAGGDIHFTDQLRLGATVFRTERAPTTEELFSDGPHLATNAFEVGDPTLDEEVAIGGEISFRNRGEKHFFTANAFYTDYEDYIFEAATGEIEDGLDEFVFTGEDAQFYGFEVQGGYEIAKIGDAVVSVDGLAEFVRAETDTDNLPRIPPFSFLVGGDVDINNISLRGEVEYAAEQNRTSFAELPTDDYTLVNGFLTWNFPAEESIKFKFSVLNIFNDDARQHTSFLKDTVPLPGRNFRLAVSADF